MERFAIVGFGCAGYHGLRAIREAGSSARVDVYSDTGLPPYNPMLTTYYTAGRLPYEGLFPFGSLSEIAREYDAHLFTETRAARVDSKNRAVVTGSGERQEYDKILVAAGASAFVPGSFANLKGAFCMRTVEDAVRLHDAIQEREYQNAVIVGASMVGIKVAELVEKLGLAVVNRGAELLHKRGCQVTLADMAPHIFALAAYPEVSEMIEARLREMGIALAFGQAIAGAEEHLDSNGKVRGYTVRLADGSTLETELLVLNIGTRAATGFLDPGEIAIDRGILVDERMETSVPGIYAAGDCSQGRNLQSGERQIIGLWANAGTQGRVAGRNMGSPTKQTATFSTISPTFWIWILSAWGTTALGERCTPTSPRTRAFTSRRW